MSGLISVVLGIYLLEALSVIMGKSDVKNSIIRIGQIGQALLADIELLMKK